MAYSVNLIYSKNQDYSNPQTVTESGQPLSIDLENLESNQTYYTKAVLKNDGTVEDEDTYTFTTLPAGTIALTHQSSTRQGSDYVVVYTYTSTYALSSSILRCGVSIAAQGVIAGNTITYTVSGLTPGDAYISQITTIDIYAESQVDPVTLVMPVVNTIDITRTTPSDTEVKVGLEYTVDGGFYEGFVSCWESTQDPDTDPSLIHWAFYNGATTVNCDNLTAGTTYKFRADIVLGDMTTEISSSVVTVTTTSAGSRDYLTLTNTAGSSNDFYVATAGDMTGKNLEYNINETGWHTYDLSNPQNITVPSGGFIQLRGANTNGINNYYNYISLRMTDTHTASGNLFSLRNTNPNTFSTYTQVLQGEFRGLFYLNAKLTDARGLGTDCITEIGANGFDTTFANNDALVYPPPFDNLVTVASNGLAVTFHSCGELVELPDYRKVTTVGTRAFGNHTQQNKKLRVVYCPNVSTWVEDVFYLWLSNAGNSARNRVAYVPNGVTIPESTSGVPSKYSRITY